MDHYCKTSERAAKGGIGKADTDRQKVGRRSTLLTENEIHTGKSVYFTLFCLAFVQYAEKQGLNFGLPAEELYDTIVCANPPRNLNGVGFDFVSLSCNKKLKGRTLLQRDEAYFYAKQFVIFTNCFCWGSTFANTKEAKA
ncbi:MAG: hypothetical protein IJH07_07760 [Ruminococcus sp.]|nr:hypothetical protein [Ruminococcus sp.]